MRDGFAGRGSDHTDRKLRRFPGGDVQAGLRQAWCSRPVGLPRDRRALGQAHRALAHPGARWQAARTRKARWPSCAAAAGTSSTAAGPERPARRQWCDVLCTFPAIGGVRPAPVVRDGDRGSRAGPQTQAPLSHRRLRRSSESAAGAPPFLNSVLFRPAAGAGSRRSVLIRVYGAREFMRQGPLRVEFVGHNRR